ncbi:MAG TPA: ABC transporter permease [Thermoplasmata archaeon]|nr:ABC transporter permease [Thermoplasmata archaeon]
MSRTGASVRRYQTGLGVFWRVLRANPLSLVGFLLVATICILALVVLLAPHLIVPYGPQQETGAYNRGPSWQHLFGTDGNSFDIYSNAMLALPLDLGIGVSLAGVSMLVGGSLGLVAGFYNRPGSLQSAVSVTILRVTDVFLAFPSLILALAITRVVGLGVLPVMFAIAVTWWPYYTRLVRGEVLALKHLPYVTAARAAGVSEGRILRRHILRNLLEPLVVYFTLDVGTVLVTYSTIGYIGVASKYPGPQPEWGAMLAYYQEFGSITTNPWLVAFPGLAIFITVLAFSLLGDGLRDILDPRTRRAFVRSTAHEPPAEATPSESGAGEGALPAVPLPEAPPIVDAQSGVDARGKGAVG